MLEETHGNVKIFLAIGKLDAFTVPYLEKNIMEYLTPENNKAILDCTDVTYMSSAGIRMFFNIIKKVNQLSGKFVICNINSKVFEVIQIARLEFYLDIARSKEDALRMMEYD